MPRINKRGGYAHLALVGLVLLLLVLPVLYLSVNNKVVFFSPAKEPTAPITGTNSVAGLPAVKIIVPGNRDIVTGNLIVMVSVADSSQTSKVELYKNNTLVGTATSAPYNFSWNSRQDPNSLVSLQAKAYDRSGTVTSSAVIKVTVAN